MLLKNQKDFFSGLLCAAMGLLFAWTASRYPLGRAAQMGPGFFPLLLGALLTVLGGLVVFKALVFETEDGGRMRPWAWRPLGLVLLALGLCGLLLAGLDAQGWLPALPMFAAGDTASPHGALLAPLLGRLLPTFGPAEICALLLLALTASACLGSGSLLKGLAMALLGLLLGLVGTDGGAGVLRFDWDIAGLAHGISNGLGIAVLALSAWLPRLPRRWQRWALWGLLALLLVLALGVYASSHSLLAVWLLAGFALAGYGLHQLGLATVPLLLGYGFATALEDSLRAALQQSQGDWGVFVTQPWSLGLLLAALGLLVLLPSVPGLRFARFGRFGAGRQNTPTATPTTKR